MENITHSTENGKELAEDICEVCFVHSSIGFLRPQTKVILLGVFPFGESRGISLVPRVNLRNQLAHPTLFWKFSNITDVDPGSTL